MSSLNNLIKIFGLASVFLVSCSPLIDRVGSRDCSNDTSPTSPVVHALDELVSALFDRTKWERLFRFDPGDANLADQWGRKVWAELDAQGFVYCRAELFSVGGISHWIIVSKHKTSGLEFSLCPGGVLQVAQGSAYKNREELISGHINIAPFLISRTEVSQEAWGRFMDYNNSSYKGALLPVESITPEEARKWCQIAGLRLPSEEEWEFACRAGSSTAFFFGDSASELGYFAWYDKNIKGGPQPVGRKLPNMFGLLDILGNVSEIVGASLADIPRVTIRDPLDPLDSGLNVDMFVIRGGSWANGALMCQSGYRSLASPLFHGNQYGFRAAASVVLL